MQPGSDGPQGNCFVAVQHHASGPGLRRYLVSVLPFKIILYVLVAGGSRLYIPLYNVRLFEMVFEYSGQYLHIVPGQRHYRPQPHRIGHPGIPRFFFGQPAHGDLKQIFIRSSRSFPVQQHQPVFNQLSAVKVDGLFIERNYKVDLLREGLHVRFFDPHSTEAVATPDPGFKVLIGENVVPAAGEGFGKYQADRLHSLARLSPDQNINIYRH